MVNYEAEMVDLCKGKRDLEVSQTFTIIFLLQDLGKIINT